MIAMETTKSEETCVCTNKKSIVLVSFELVIIATRIILIYQLHTGIFLFLALRKEWNLESPELLGQQNASRHTIFFSLQRGI